MTMISYKEAAEILGLPLGTVYSLVCQRRIPHHRLGPRLVRFQREDLEQWLMERRVDQRQRQPNES